MMQEDPTSVCSGNDDFGWLQEFLLNQSGVLFRSPRAIVGAQSRWGAEPSAGDERTRARADQAAEKNKGRRMRNPHQSGSRSRRGSRRQAYLVQ